MTALWLEPFGLQDGYVFVSPESRDRALAENPYLQGQTHVIQRQDRPRTWLVNGSLLAPQGYKSDDRTAFSFQMSPDFVGCPFYPYNDKVTYERANYFFAFLWARPKLENVVVGGGMVETFAFGGAGSQTQAAGEKVELPAPDAPFGLSKMIAISSMAPAQVLAELSKTSTSATEVGKYWPVTSPMFPESQGDLEYVFGDGGTVDNSGLLPLLQRGVKRILWFAHSYTGTNESFDAFDFAAGAPGMDVLEFGIIESLLDKFGYGKSGPSFFAEENQVFKEEDLWPILEKLQALKRDGKPGVVRSSLIVQKNSKWGIVGGHTVEVVLVYLAKVTDFERSLPKDTQDEIAKGQSGSFPNYPHLATTGLIPEDPINYKSRHVNLLAAQLEYTVQQAADVIRDVLSLPEEARPSEVEVRPTLLGAVSSAKTVPQNSTNL